MFLCFLLDVVVPGFIGAGFFDFNDWWFFFLIGTWNRWSIGRTLVYLKEHLLDTEPMATEHTIATDFPVKIDPLPKTLWAVYFFMFRIKQFYVPNLYCGNDSFMSQASLSAISKSINEQ